MRTVHASPTCFKWSDDETDLSRNSSYCLSLKCWTSAMAVRRRSPESLGRKRPEGHSKALPPLRPTLFKRAGLARVGVRLHLI